MSVSWIDVFDQCREKNFPCVLYCYPESNEIHFQVQTNSSRLEEMSPNEISQKKGFVLGGFNLEKEPILLLTPSHSGTKSDLTKFTSDLKKINGLDSVESIKELVSVDKETYLKQFKIIKKALDSNEYGKLVLSRIVNVEFEKETHPAKLFEELVRVYPNAFKYLIFSEKGIWIGASPETLISSTSKSVSTVSLAGTQRKKHENDLPRDVVWGKKEQVEQEIVSKYIRDVFHEMSIDTYSEKGPYTIEVGNLYHLRTEFTIPIKKGNWDSNLIAKLHPTPAVCGIPKQNSLHFIESVESHDRLFYSGIVGTVNEGEVAVYVNLRCGRIDKNSIAIFAGGGITIESEAEKEWLETQYKADILRSVLEN